jgi:hypothetical protein
MQLTLNGVPPYDGTYTLNLERMTNREIHTIKRISGYTPIEYNDAGKRGDTDFWVGVAIVGLHRAGHAVVNEDAIWDADAGAIAVTFDDEQEQNENPPHQATAAAESDSQPSSGPPSSTDSATHPESNPISTGTPDSDTGVISNPIRSVS